MGEHVFGGGKPRRSRGGWGHPYFDGLELRKAAFDGSDYTLSAQTETVYLDAGGARARVLYAEEDLPTLTSGQQHVFLIFADHLGSGNFIVDHETGELVEYSTYQAYGQTDSDYRPARWGEFREPYKFSGKEEDVEVGLAYFGARYLSLGLGRWISPDPVTLHNVRGDLNPYAYVKGRPLVAVDPDGRFAVLTAVLVGAAIGMTINATVQLSRGGEFNWGSFFAAGATGAAGGLAGPLAGTLGGALLVGAGTGALGYGLDVWWGGGEFSWGGMGLSVGIGMVASAAGYGISNALQGKGAAAASAGDDAADGATATGGASKEAKSLTNLNGEVVDDPLELIAVNPDNPSPTPQTAQPTPTPKPQPTPKPKAVAPPAKDITVETGPPTTNTPRPVETMDNPLGLACKQPGYCTVPDAGGAGRSVDELSAAGRAPAAGGRTRAGYVYQKHMGRGELPKVSGKELDQAGQDLLDDVLTHPGTTVHPVTSGNAAGGTRFIGPNGIGATFGPDGSLMYFGRY